jgi:hypothetical protein
VSYPKSVGIVERNEDRIMNRFLFLLFLLGILISEPGCLRIISPPASILAVEANVSAIAVTGKSTIADYACMKY